MKATADHFTLLGTHLVQVDGDTVFLRSRGKMTLADMREILRVFTQVKREYGRLFALYDASRGDGIDLDARHLAANRPTADEYPDLQVAFGISFAQRVVLNMILRAHKALQNRPVRLHLFDKEQEARAYFGVEREKLRQAGWVYLEAFMGLRSRDVLPGTQDVQGTQFPEQTQNSCRKA